MNPGDNVTKIEAAIKDLELDYMRGWVSEEEYRTKMTDLRQQLQDAGVTPSEIPSMHRIDSAELQAAKLRPPQREGKATVDPVTAVKRTIQAMRKISIERISQESGVSSHNVTKIITDLLDGRELSGRIDHDSGDFILGTGTGPAPKTIHGCPYCRTELERVAVKGETVTCSVCRESFIVS
ncbi:MAG: PCI domain-containing protein [Candidatus Thorarchaeota archaeon]|nr:PCI domain-containing protein [Candidatus Thorarchaeota archaeon]